MQKIKRFLTIYPTSYFSKDHHKNGVRFLSIGMVVGILSALLALLFRVAIDDLSILIFGGSEGISFVTIIRSLTWWQIFLPPIIGGTFVAYFTKRFAPEAQGHGVPEIMIAMATQRGILRLRITIVKLIASTVSIASGFSVGREGPTALIGSSLGSFFGQFLRLPASKVKMLVGCGAAAGIAATFNAPLAGTAFAIELIVRKFEVRVLSPIVFSAMIATVISHYFLGDFHSLFSEINFKIEHPGVFALYAGLGVFAGVVGVVYTKLLYAAEDISDKILIPAWLKGAIGGVGIGFVLYFFPEATGPATWEAIRMPLTQTMDSNLAWMMLLLVVVKMIATAWSMGTGASGGIFAPGLFLGGGLGAAYGHYMNKLFPLLTSSTQGYALVGMGAIVAAITQAPLTAVTMMFELTNNHSIVLPLIIAGGLALTIYNHFLPGSIYTIKLQRRNLYLEDGRETGVLQGLKVSQILQPEMNTLAKGARLDEVFEAFSTLTRSTLPVVDANRRLLGVLSFWDTRNELKSANHSSKVASDVMNPYFYFITPQENLYQAFNMISKRDFEYLPVVESRDSMQLVGKLSRRDLLQAYRNALTIRGIMSAQDDLSRSV